MNMDIKINNASPSFKSVHVVSKEAEKLLKKADRIVKQSNAIYMDVNIPKGHKKPLWSVLSEHLIKRQQNNKNNIIIDLYEKSKQLLSVAVVDSKGVVEKKWTVNPMPVIGKYNDVFPPEDILTYKAYKSSLNPKTYGKSEFFNVIDNAEALADRLHEQFLSALPPLKTHIKELPKPKKNKAPKAPDGFVLHVQRPFEHFGDLLEKVEKISIKPKETSKVISKDSSRLPRKAKKEAKRRAV